MPPNESEAILKKLYEKIDSIEEGIEKVKHHPSQNGGWKEMMALIGKIDERLVELDHSLNDPRTGAVAEVQALVIWRTQVEAAMTKLQESGDRLLKMEMQVGAYNKVTWAAAIGVVGLVIKSIMGLVLV